MLDDPDGGHDEYGYDCAQSENEDEVSTEAPQTDEEMRGASDFPTDNSDLDENVIPPWNGGLTEEQIQEWNVAEKLLGTCRTVKGWLTAKRKIMAKKSCRRVRPASRPRPRELNALLMLEPFPGATSGKKMKWSAISATMRPQRQRK